ncbi:MAG TPA: formyltransferase family protein, partial [Fibrobacteria bacterium]|nr:formyltransferase family protein [Fibrobacteria bacterium]
VSTLTEGSDAAAAARMVELVDRHGIDLLVLAGYMKLVYPSLLARLRNRVVNIHPALLPAFGGEGCYGHRIHEAVVTRGCQYTGVTIHMVNEHYDAGQIVLQRVVPVRPGMTADMVGAAVLEREHLYYWKVIRAFADGEIVPTASDAPDKAVELSRFLARMSHEEEPLS